MKTKILLSMIIAIFFLSQNGTAWAKKDKKKEVRAVPARSLNQKVLGTLWSQTLQSGSSKRYYPESASPLLLNGHVYIGTHSGIFYALSASQRGHIIWQFKSNGPIASQPATDGNRVYFGNNKGTVYALDAATGKPVWEHFVGGEILAQPALTGKILYVVTTSREVYSLDTETGDEKWSQYVRGFEKKFTVRGNSPVVVAGNNITIGFADGQVACLSAKGDILWTRFLSEERTAFKDLDARLLLEGGVLYAVGYYGTVARLDVKTGNVVWKRNARSGVDMETDNTSLYLSTSDNKVMALNKADGNPRWAVALNAGTQSALRLIDNYLLVGTQEHGAYVLDREEGRVLQHLSLAPGFIGNISGDDSSVVVLSSSGSVYALGRAGLK